jgi:hypothetical protein
LCAILGTLGALPDDASTGVLLSTVTDANIHHVEACIHEISNGSVKTIIHENIFKKMVSPKWHKTAEY